MKIPRALCAIPVVMSLLCGVPEAITLTRLTSESSVDGYGDWSPDGNMICFASDRESSGTFHVWTVSADGGSAQMITSIPGYEPRWSPDGQTIVFQSTMYGNWDVYLTPSMGGEPVRLTVAGDCVNPSWSPGSDTIIFRHLESGNYDLYKTSVSSPEMIRVTDATGEESFPAYSPNGETIVFQHKPLAAGSRDVFLMPSEGGPYSPLIAWSGDEGAVPNWSPDGRYVAFSSRLADGGDGEIWVVDARGESYGLWRITDTPADEVWPSWSPDGKKILFTSQQPDNTDIWIATDLPWEQFVSFPPESLAPCDDQPVSLTHSQPLNGGMIPFKIPAGAVITGISTTGLITEGWTLQIDSLSCPDAWAVGFWSETAPSIPAGVHTIFNIEFNIPRLCNESRFIVWDTACMGDPVHELLLSDTTFAGLACAFACGLDSTEIAGYSPGDINDDGNVNVADLTALVNFMFNGGPMCVMNAGDVNGDCTGPNIADLTYQVAFLFQGGNTPQCGCIGGAALKPAIGGDISVSYDAGITLIHLSSDQPLRGIQVSVEGSGILDPVCLLGDDLDIIAGTTSIGLLDLEGSAVIEAGQHDIIRIPGKWIVVEALGSTLDHQSVLLSSAASTVTPLPVEFALDQNYPNPFNPSTEISFSLPAAGQARLAVYNVMGQQVIELVDGRLDAGPHTVTWDGRDQSGTSVASGVYFYRLETGTATDTKKMMLLK